MLSDPRSLLASGELTGNQGLLMTLPQGFTVLLGEAVLGLKLSFPTAQSDVQACSKLLTHTQCCRVHTAFDGHGTPRTLELLLKLLHAAESILALLP